MDFRSDKSYRLLKMNEQLVHGEALQKDVLVSMFVITPKTVQRDIDALRLYLSETGKGEM